MAIIKCKECGSEVSTKASACPKCGAKIITTHPVTIVIGLGLCVLLLWALFVSRNGQKEIENQAATNQAPDTQASISAKELIAQVDALNDQCRDGRGDYEKACDQRDALGTKLQKMGWCWGHEDQIMAERNWERCGNAVSAQANPVPPTQPAIKVSAQEFYDDYHANEVAADAKYKGKLIEINGTVANISKSIGSIIVGLNAPSDFSTVHLRELSQDQTINLKKGQFIRAKCVADGMVLTTPYLNCKGAKIQQ